MKLLKDKFFEWDEKLELREKSDFDLEVFFDEIRDVVSSIFTEFNSLKEDWSSEIEVKIDDYISRIKKQYKDNEFIENIVINSFYPDFKLSTYYCDESLNIEWWYLWPNKEALKKFTDKYANTHYWHYYWNKNEASWIFSDFDSLETDFIEKYKKFEKIAIEKTKENDLKILYKKFNFKFSNHTKTYLKPIYIKWSFSDKDRYKGEHKYKDKLEKDFLINEFKNKFKGWSKTVQNIYPEIPWENTVKCCDSFCNKIDIKHFSNIKLKSWEIIKVIVIDDEILALSLDKNNTASWVYEFLEEMYFDTKTKLISGVKTWIENILMNFSSEESNIINQWNYYQYKNYRNLWFLNTTQDIDEEKDVSIKSHYEFNKTKIPLQNDAFINFNDKQIKYYTEYLWEYDKKSEAYYRKIEKNIRFQELSVDSDGDFDMLNSWLYKMRSNWELTRGKIPETIIKYKLYWENDGKKSPYFTHFLKEKVYSSNPAFWGFNKAYELLLKNTSDFELMDIDERNKELWEYLNSMWIKKYESGGMTITD